MEKHFYACSINQCNLFHPQLIGVVSIILVRNSDRIIWLDDTFRDILIQWMRTPTHHREFAVTLWKRKHLILGRTSRRGCHPPPPHSPPFWGFSEFSPDDVNQIGGSATSFPALCLVDRKDLFFHVPLCNVNFPRFSSKVFLLPSCKKSFSLDLVVSFPSPSESLNCTCCTTKTHGNVYSRNARVPAC